MIVSVSCPVNGFSITVGEPVPNDPVRPTRMVETIMARETEGLVMFDNDGKQIAQLAPAPGTIVLYSSRPK